MGLAILIRSSTDPRQTGVELSTVMGHSIVLPFLVLSWDWPLFFYITFTSPRLELAKTHLYLTSSLIECPVVCDAWSRGKGGEYVGPADIVDAVG